MRIRELVIRNFGKFTDKKIEFGDGINLIYGENESGKSTIHSFIKGMLFGMERGRGRASVNDTFSQYEPWTNPNFYSGILRFESGGKHFYIDRNFDKYSKRAAFICEDDGEEFSVEHGDLSVILGGLAASGYDDTISIRQLKAKPGQSLAAELKDYATNYYATGDDEIHLDEALTVLGERKKSLEKKIREDLIEKQKKRERLELEASYVWRDVEGLTQELDDISEELLYQRQCCAEKEQPAGKSDEVEPSKWRIHPLEIVLFFLAIVLSFALISRPWNYLVAIILFLACGIYVWNRMKVSKRPIKTEPERILEEIAPERLEWEKSRIEEELKEKQTKCHNLKEQLDELDEINEAHKELDKRRRAAELAISTLENLSAKFQETLRKKLNVRATEILTYLTEGKYSGLFVDDDLHMYLVCEGMRVAMEQVSQGTVEQTYFALRMAVSELFHEEDYPVILDDTFVLYDEKRLKRVLCWLSENRKQVILFTCQKREEEVLRGMGVPFILLNL